MARNDVLWYHIDGVAFGRFMEENGLTAKDLSKDTGLARSTVKEMIFDGKMSIATAMRFQSTYRRSFEEMFGPDDSEAIRRLRKSLGNGFEA